jgi:hypothetical protein
MVAHTTVLTLDEVAALTGRSPNTLRAYITSRISARRRLVPPGAFRAPGARRWVWDRETVEAWLRSGESLPQPGRPKKTKGAGTAAPRKRGGLGA